MYRRLVYHKENRRLCIFASMKKNIFCLAYDQNQHLKTIRCLHRIKKSIFMFRLFKRLRPYIDHCFQCQFNQTKKHKVYEKLMFIISSAIFFYTIIMNFIITISNEFDTLLIIICKFSKKSTYFVKNWVVKIMNRFLIFDLRHFNSYNIEQKFEISIRILRHNIQKIWNNFVEIYRLSCLNKRIVRKIKSDNRNSYQIFYIKQFECQNNFNFINDSVLIK